MAIRQKAEIKERETVDFAEHFEENQLSVALTTMAHTRHTHIARLFSCRKISVASISRAGCCLQLVTFRTSSKQRKQVCDAGADSVA